MIVHPVSKKFFELLIRPSCASRKMVQFEVVVITQLFLFVILHIEVCAQKNVEVSK